MESMGKIRVQLVEFQAMLHGLGFGVSDTGMDPSVRLVETLTLGHGDTVQNLDI